MIPTHTYIYIYIYICVYIEGNVPTNSFPLHKKDNFAFKLDLSIYLGLLVYVFLYLSLYLSHTHYMYISDRCARVSGPLWK